MTNESKQAQADNEEVITEEMVINQEGADESNLIDELTQANFRVEELEQQLLAAEATVVEQKDSVVRAAAEVDNIRRRSAVEVEKARKFALEKFVSELLPVIDNMERALAAGNPDDEATKAIHEGVELTLKTLTSAVAKFGVVQVDPMGEAFNPEQHQAIGMQPSTEFAANTVMMVMQKGFMLNERLLRPAMVMVSQG
ncbi:nucleotide exchange factor GrpE [Shewanella sp. SNU WT4]|uniref:nucleotide exchange factor GrpE n=1 Tax=Shewanella sp. SNU WT4 TaxID=2590015 RepID=UPI0011262EE8|nr:nucleotide exchange factor GrpE [Shewanella sp. SNU WT4]QDF66447.1 nucleotide exchange factor GrpE [Shewanella sp. SNU WT4]